MSAAPTGGRLGGMSTPIRHFIRHYLEMVAAMVAGMVVLGIPAEALLKVAGTSAGRLETAAPEVLFLGMALIMTIPMVALMRHRGHAWRPCWEMSASMFLPTFAAIALLRAGAATPAR
jgi:flagellar biosynthetic protein FliP